MYALLALGFVLVYGILELINFSHFNVFMVGSFVGMAVLHAFGIAGQSDVLTGFSLIGVLPVAFAVTMLACGPLGVVIERLSPRPLRNVTGPVAMITTIGVSYILLNVVLLSLGADAKNFPNPLPPIKFEIGGAVLRLKEILIWTVSFGLMLALWLFVHRSRKLEFIPISWRKAAGLWLLLFAVLAFPLVHDNDADIEPRPACWVTASA